MPSSRIAITRRALRQIVGAVAFAGALSASHPAALAKCDSDDPRVGAQLKALKTKWEELHKLLRAAKYVGKAVQQGKCAVTLLRIGAPTPFSLPPDEGTKDLEEAINCVVLENWTLLQICKCQDLGLNYAKDDSGIQDDTRKLYEQVSHLDQKATSLGIKNKFIRSWVNNANKVRYCFDRRTLQILENTKKNLEGVIDASTSK